MRGEDEVWRRRQEELGGEVGQQCLLPIRALTATIEEEATVCDHPLQ